LYNTQDDPGGPTFDPTGTAFAKLFTVDKSGLAPGWELHFDLYNKDRRGRVDINAPFSHDASTIPEPTGFLLTLGGLSLFACLRRMRG
ncbi:MAG: choice-of-anchor N protein, partial [Verrucomicrobiae bacterium]|nr:choice-of-anchor N protein [Verrucomicrobiae bacterium]